MTRLTRRNQKAETEQRKAHKTDRKEATKRSSDDKWEMSATDALHVRFVTEE